MTTTDRDGGELDDLFAEVRAQAPEPAPDLMARIFAEAERVAAERERRGPAPVRQGAWREWLRLLGGWPTVGGLVASTLAGLWIGVAQPPGLSDLADTVWGEQVSVTVGLDADPLSLLEG
jgi:hypothetical protein